MIVELNGKRITINDNEINASMKALEITREEAINLWLADNDYISDEEQEELDRNAKKVKINHGAGDTAKRKSVPKTVKVSDEKQALFGEIYMNLYEKFGNNVEIAKENKLLLVHQGEKTFKIDLIEMRIKK